MIVLPSGWTNIAFGPSPLPELMSAARTPPAPNDVSRVPSLLNRASAKSLPLLPLLAHSFDVSAGQAGLLMTVTMLPLAVAPIVYGYFLQQATAMAPECLADPVAHRNPLGAGLSAHLLAKPSPLCLETGMYVLKDCDDPRCGCPF